MTIFFIAIGAVAILIAAAFLMGTQQRKHRTANRLESAFTRARAYRLTRTGIVNSKPYV